MVVCVFTHIFKERYLEVQNNLLDDDEFFYHATKEYGDDKNLNKFKIIQQGAAITKGELY